MKPVDKDALTRAMKICAEESPSRADQLRWKLENDLWENVARFAAYCCQTQSMNLAPWEDPPCCADIKGGPAFEYLQRMLDAGLSRWEPNPSRALSEVLSRPKAKGRKLQKGRKLH